MALIPLTQGASTIVDDADHPALSVHKWYLSGQGYAVRKVGGRADNRMVYMHRVLAGAPDGVLVDHINGDKLDNRRANLRLATRQQNGMNRGANRLAKGKTSQYKGVSFQDNRWVASITVDRQKVIVGRYASEIEAAQAYDAEARRRFGSYAWLNFPKETSHGV